MAMLYSVTIWFFIVGFVFWHVFVVQNQRQQIGGVKTELNTINLWNNHTVPDHNTTQLLIIAKVWLQSVVKTNKEVKSQLRIHLCG